MRAVGRLGERRSADSGNDAALHNRQARGLAGGGWRRIRGRHGLAFFQQFFGATPDETTLPGAVDALRVLEVLDAIYEAGRTGQTVAVARQV